MKISDRLRYLESHQLLLLLIPKPESERLQARFQRQGLDVGEHAVFIVTGSKLIVGDAWAQMVYVVKTDIAREPLQQPGQFVE